jgi:hypothetical protein
MRDNRSAPRNGGIPPEMIPIHVRIDDDQWTSFHLFPEQVQRRHAEFGRSERIDQRIEPFGPDKHAINLIPRPDDHDSIIEVRI